MEHYTKYIEALRVLGFDMLAQEIHEVYLKEGTDTKAVYDECQTRLAEASQITSAEFKARYK